MNDGPRQTDPWDVLRLARLSASQLLRQLDRLMIVHRRVERGDRDRAGSTPAPVAVALPAELGGGAGVPLEALASAGRIAATLRDQLAAAYVALRDGGGRG